MINVGERIREIRKSKNINVSTLAEQIGVAQSFMSGMENGNKKCSLDNLDAICQALNITLSNFFTEDKPDLEPDLKQLLDVARKLTPEEREYLTKFIEARKD